MVDSLLQFVPSEVLSLICGKLLGDGNLTIEKTRQPRFRFQHCFSDHEWSIHCYESLKSYIPLSPPKKRLTPDSRLTKGYSESMYVQSKTSPLFNSLKQLWYQENKKVIPFELLNLVFDERGLAWWYQDDGHLSVSNNKVRKIILSTDYFSKDENEKLIALLKQKFYLTFALDGQNRLCLYDQKQILIFLKIVQDYIHSSMKRKIIDCNQHQQVAIPNQKRTTLSLPSFIPINSPTQNIKDMIDKIDLESFIQYWFHTWHKEDILFNEGKLLVRFQILLQSEQLIKLEKIKDHTGLNMNEILYLSILNY